MYMYMVAMATLSKATEESLLKDMGHTREQVDRSSEFYVGGKFRKLLHDNV